MSKFFNDTLKSRGPAFPVQPTESIGVQDVTTSETEALPRVAELERNQTEPAPAAKVEISESNLLITKFKGSKLLQSAEESYSALRTRLLRMRAARGLRSVLVTSSIQGEGKTLTSVNLAVSCSQLHENRVLLIDGDIRTAALTESLGITSRQGVAEILSGQCPPEAAVLPTNYPNLFVCGAGSTRQPPPELYASDRWKQFIEWSGHTFKLVLVDSPPVLNLTDVELMLAACDGALLVVRARHTRRDVLQKSAGQIEGDKFLGVVYNGSEAAHNNYYISAYKEK
jgi:protein-tyrosine kinase